MKIGETAKILSTILHCSFSLKNPVSSSSFGSSNSFDSAKFCRHPFDYGQISRITVLPVTGDWILRANLKNHRFARNEGCILRANLKNHRFARNG